MKRGSIIGPVLLIAAGILFLVYNLRPDLPALKFLSDWWPFLLIAWGLGRIAEITIWWRTGRPLPTNGISGGEWTLAVVLSLIGTGMFYGQHFRNRIPGITVRGLGEVLGENFEYNHDTKRVAAGKTPRVRVENMRGSARITGIESEEVIAKGVSNIKAYTQNEADKANSQAVLEVVRQGDVIIVRSNHDRASEGLRVSSELEVTVPKGATIECKGRYGDFDVTDVAGSLVVDSDNTGVRAANIGGDVRIETRRSDILRAINVKGNVELRGSGSDVELENIEGTSVVNGSFYGDLAFRKLAKPFRFESSSTEIRVAKVPGRIEMSRGHLTGDDLSGPVFVRGRSKDVQLSSFSDGLELQIDKGDVELRPKLPVGKMDVRIRGGDVDLALPGGAKVELNAVTERGEIFNGIGAPFQQGRQGRGARMTGSTGAGPVLSLHTDRGKISVRSSTGFDVPTPPAAPAAPAPPSPPGASTLTRERQ